MLRDYFNSQPHQNTHFDFDLDYTEHILEFVDNNISGFKSFFSTQIAGSYENRISDLLVHYLQCRIRDRFDGILPYEFRKNPTQIATTKETDIGVYLMTLGQKQLQTIFDFEAKRLSTSSKYKEYVSGERGGIERFKKGEHASHINTCGMLGYIQSNTSKYWTEKINDHIDALAKGNVESTLVWSNINEQLTLISSDECIDKLRSEHYRDQSNDIISLFHYMIDLT